MCILGIKTLVFSTEDGNFTKIRFRDYIPKQKSLGRHFIEHGYKQIHRNKINKSIQDINGKMIINNYLLDISDNSDNDTSSISSHSSID